MAIDMVTGSDIKAALAQIGIENDDTVIFHSSLKSFGVVDGGAETVIAAIKEYLKNGTVVFPALRSRDFENAYKDWDINNTPSDLFPKHSESKRAFCAAIRKHIRCALAASTQSL